MRGQTSRTVRFFINVVALFCCSISAASSQVETSASQETKQIAVAPGVVAPVTDKVELFALGALIRGNRTTTFAQFDVRFKINKFLTVTPGYFGLFVPKVNGRRNYDNRARLAATLNFSLGNLKISDRNLVERRFRTSADSTRYRNQIRLEHPVKFGTAAFNLYGYTEPVYDFSENRWTRNFAALGANKTFAKRYTADVFYLGQFARGGPTVKAVVFGFTVRLPRMFSKEKAAKD